MDDNERKELEYWQASSDKWSNIALAFMERLKELGEEQFIAETARKYTEVQKLAIDTVWLRKRH